MVRFLLLLISHLVFALYQGTSKPLIASSPEEPHCRLAQLEHNREGQGRGKTCTFPMPRPLIASLLALGAAAALHTTAIHMCAFAFLQ